MAFNLQNPFSIFIFVCSIASLFASNSLCSSDDLFANGDGFSPALGTWYGDPRGAGSGGACGWANWANDEILGFIYKEKDVGIVISREPYCSLNPITITIIDECPGACNNVPFHFDLSGTAFGAMANPGQADNLRNLGQVDIQYRRVPCYYGRTKIAFKIDAKTNPNWFAPAIEFEDGDGGLSSVEISPAGSQQFVPMKNIWGAVWEADVSPSFHGPYSFRLRSPTGKVVVASNVVPNGFVPGQTYFSNVNF
uniref:Expansin-like EG45 domain-containing protein n=1 Tax=Lactuca sativa TaxID=4236 RepID=A0A9R1UCB9_LACSA|nr:hypothetical protein LSAT_V11C900504020 [Lactuca sativa]